MARGEGGIVGVNTEESTMVSLPKGASWQGRGTVGVNAEGNSMARRPHLALVLLSIHTLLMAQWVTAFSASTRRRGAGGRGRTGDREEEEIEEKRRSGGGDKEIYFRL